MLHEEIDQRAARLFRADEHGRTAEACAQLNDPVGQRGGLVLNGEELGLSFAASAQTQIVLLIGPIQADESSRGSRARSVRNLDFHE